MVLFADLGATGPLDPELFYKGKNGLESDDRLGYDKTSGKLFFDENGSQAGEKHLIAVFDKGTALKAADIDVSDDGSEGSRRATNTVRRPPRSQVTRSTATPRQSIS